MVVKVFVVTFIFYRVVESATVALQFHGTDESIYHIQWTELLQVGTEIPFQEYESVEVGTAIECSTRKPRLSLVTLLVSSVFIVIQGNEGLNV